MASRLMCPQRLIAGNTGPALLLNEKHLSIAGKPLPDTGGTMQALYKFAPDDRGLFC